MGSPFESLQRNLEDAKQLQGIHASLTGKARGRRFDIDVLNRSGIVLVVAAWESLVEDVASAAFDEMLQRAPDHSVIPARVLTLAAAPLRQDRDERRVWELADNGWRTVLVNHRVLVIEDFLSGFHTPRPAKVDALFERLIGLPGMAKQWTWRKNSVQDVHTKFEELIDLRGRIAHRLAPGRYVTKAELKRAVELVGRAAAITQNRVGDYLFARIGHRPWSKASYGSAE